MEAIDIRSFEFSYPQKAPVFKGIDWRIEQGSFVLLVGLTGSGKSTLLRCLKPEMTPEGARAGSITAFGKDIENMTHLESAQHIGYVDQSPDNQIVCDTVWHEIAFGMENIGLDQGLMRRRVAEVAHFFSIESWIHQKTATLSGGQKQLVTLAGVLALQPKLLLLDEPTAQLDPVAEKNFLHALFRINRELGITVVMATHDSHAMRAYATSTYALDERSGSITTHPALKTAIRERYPHPQTQTGDTLPPRPGDVLPPTLRLGVPISRDKGTPSFEAHEARHPQATQVQLRDVHFGYERNSQPVLRDLTLDISSKQTHALVGGNGCGKSTFLRIVAGALKPQYGRIANPYQNDQALLPQDPKALFVCDTVEDELREWQRPCGYTDADVDEIVAALALEQLLRAHPYDLSGGQQQLLALAKLLLKRPALLLLDEPTKGLDAVLRSQMVTLLAGFERDGGTIIIATHDLEFVGSAADQVSLMFDGEIACTEPTAQFFENDLFYRSQKSESI